MDQLQYRLEVIIGNLLGFIQVPPPGIYLFRIKSISWFSFFDPDFQLSGGPQIRFNIGADDRQAVQPPMSASLPVSRDSVTTFCQELGK
jgi:myotubularin-related protein 5/13